MKVPLGDLAESVSKEKKMDHEPLVRCNSRVAADDFAAHCMEVYIRTREKALRGKAYAAVWFDQEGTLVVKGCPTPADAVLSVPGVDPRFWLVFEQDGNNYQLLRDRSHFSELFAGIVVCRAFIAACVSPALTQASG